VEEGKKRSIFRILEKRQLILLLIYSVGCLYLLYFSLTEKISDKNQRQGMSNRGKQVREESYFKEVDYYVLRESDPFLRLKAQEMGIDHDRKRILFHDPQGVVYSKSNRPINFKGLWGKFNFGSNQIYLNKKVRLTMEDMQLDTDKLHYNLRTGYCTGTGNVITRKFSPVTKDKIRVDSDFVEVWTNNKRSHYQGNVSGVIQRKRVYETGISFSTNDLYLDLERLLAELKGDVLLKKQTITAKARRGEIFLDNYNKTLKYYALYDDVKVNEVFVPQGKSVKVERKAFAEKVEGIVSEEKVVLTGNPKVIQGRDVIKGNKIVIRERNQTVEIDDATSKFLLR